MIAFCFFHVQDPRQRSASWPQRGNEIQRTGADHFCYLLMTIGIGRD
jgi:hypothetical protein